jgi:hypothetical protein
MRPTAIQSCTEGIVDFPEIDQQMQGLDPLYILTCPSPKQHHRIWIFSNIEVAENSALP